MEDKIFENGKYWQRISGPWADYENPTMQAHIDGFKPNIECITKKDYTGTHVYRDAKGYINQRTVEYKYIPKEGSAKISEFRQLQKERQRDMQRLCEK